MGSRQEVQRIIGTIIAILIGIWLIGQPVFDPQINSQISSSPILSTNKPSEQAVEKELTALPPAAAPEPTHSQTVTELTRNPQSLRPEPGTVCGFDPAIVKLMSAFPQEQWLDWIEILSGEEPVTINGETFTILTRYSESMFNGDPDARAYEFMISQLRQWGYVDNVTLFEQEFTPSIGEETSIWKNIIVVIPGSDPELRHEQVLLTAHLDSTSKANPEERAPGADDNGSGVATLLEAARVFRDHTFRRTIKIVFFTGEEQGLHGSQAYVNEYRDDLGDILGIFNTDMFGYDGDNDRCFEIHVGRLEDSNQVGGCLADIAEWYALDLKFDYLVSEAIGASDHSTFWNAGVGAIEVLENFNTHGFQGGCSSADKNPNYHSEMDLIKTMNIDTSHSIAKAVIAAVASFAGIVEN